MFGFVTANIKELSKEEIARYNAVYCGICRRIRMQSSSASRLGLSYDMAFLALLLLSLYEPEEKSGKKACGFHPLNPRPWVDDPIIAYCADMNTALCYYKALDDDRDERKPFTGTAIKIYEKSMDRIFHDYPRQCKTMDQVINRLSQLEKSRCRDADLLASCFGDLMAELFVYKEDRWQSTLRDMGMSLGRFIYLADAAIDYREDVKKGRYNPYIAMGTGTNWVRWEEYLVMEMGRCTEYYGRLPIVKDKKILDNILYSGIWMSYRQKQRGERKHNG